MRIALMQAEAAPLDPEKNLSAIDAAAAAALDAGAELLLAPELFVTGYVPRSLASWLTPERVAEFPAELSRIAAARGIAVAAGFPAARMDGGFAIAAGLWDRGGAEVLRYEKVHLWGAEERLAFIASDAEPRIAEWNGRRVAFQICYDIEFPEPARALAARGADLLLVPTAIDGESDYVAEVLVRARAAENRLVVAYADHARSADAPLDEPTAGFAGLSTVAGPEGVVLGTAGRGSEVLIADIPDPNGARPGSADYLADRRPEIYGRWS
ncbi:nitrilase [Leucobacter sp. OLJS4]|uniref:nitrilase-related carbon-nitrogen hydrolase n=1 Tax=unclassified Leucobacter TaxID=2621730 RepID=UPI000C1A8276|nr:MULTISPECIES: nitrilase-related carbon-nitrogen hydrolase [unclassified Leucobacter]PIJ55176.1 nitrilase [Leucobacter sp. OLES1]PII84388.1 nitrilase [Leucobacter sp. OLCALW19]PII91017.1 nitrilase [Leucobacter sp. OLAS13]PII95644.1 nitrilase [Leucobacter sp. OLTLW20]PII96835.1 nitrilase [Leucobacter sp. OLCS4]